MRQGFHDRDEDDGLFTIEKFSSIFPASKLISKHVKKVKNFRREIIINQIVRELINVMVVAVINTTNKKRKKENTRSIEDMKQHDHLIVDFTDKIKKVDMKIKDL